MRELGEEKVEERENSRGNGRVPSFTVATENQKKKAQTASGYGNGAVILPIRCQKRALPIVFLPVYYQPTSKQVIRTRIKGKLFLVSIYRYRDGY